MLAGYLAAANRTHSSQKVALMTIGYWFRKDLRLHDNEALTLAVHASNRSGTSITPFYIELDTSTYRSEFKPSQLRQDSLVASLHDLDRSLGGLLSFFTVVAELAAVLKQKGVQQVFATRAFDPEGQRAEQVVSAELAEAGISLQLFGSQYSIEPGTVRKDDGLPLKVYTPFFRRWNTLDHKPPLSAPVGKFSRLTDADANGAKIGSLPPLDSRVRVGEGYARKTLERFLEQRVHNYASQRDRADLGGTSHLSHALAHGEIHPRTILNELPAGEGAEVFRKELAWREFYADVLHHHPNSLWGYFDPKFQQMRYDEGSIAEERFEAWRLGQTGYPIVDAGMRQLKSIGWMHNRVRMITASFLIKDLHLPWFRGADWFQSQLTDFDPASNAHGWQWTAGCGTDASPYFRIFNPVLQGQKFDPYGDYVRRYIPELDHLSAKEIHEPWKYLSGLGRGYMAPIVDHATERDESLRRLEELKQRVNSN